MTDNIQYVAYADMGNVGSEGMALNIKNSKDRFEISLNGIDFLFPSDKKMLLQKVMDHFPHYQKLNPYALVLGYIMCDETGAPDAELLMRAEELRITKNDFDGRPLKNKLSSTDIIRYARLYQRLRLKDPVFHAAPEPEDDNLYDNYDEYDENREFDEYGYESGGNEYE